jgi:hypothetical protein
MHNTKQRHWLGFRLGVSQLKLYRYFKNKDIAILIPGCGNTYEALIFRQGFTNVTVIDIAPTLVKY